MAFSSSLPKKGMFPLAKKTLEHMLSLFSEPVAVVRVWSGAEMALLLFPETGVNGKQEPGKAVCDGHSIEDRPHSICILS